MRFSYPDSKLNMKLKVSGKSQFGANGRIDSDHPKRKEAIV